ncbi:MAG: AraC family transcriptional regulator [Eubacteriales bacterium]|jgi:AraC family L-rhamnose operon regulatory protein RhaS|nr:AraC family transcriptional regulator [Eubacteriales bacterium]
MPAPGMFLDDKIFEPDSVKIRVMSAEHNGKTWLHRHAFYEFVYIDTGFTLHSHDGRTSVLTAGDLFAICPNEAHSYSSSYHTNLFNCLFYLEELSGLEDEILSLPGMGELARNSGTPFPVLHVGLSERRDLVLILEKMKWESQTRASGWQLNLKSLLISFLIFYSRLYCTEQTARKNQDSGGYYNYIYRALEYIENNYKNDIGGREIAECTGLSHDYIAKQFKNVLSMTPTEYIRRFRVAKSMELLKTTTLSAAEIAAEVGFGDISLYSRVFKQLMGITPTAFRRSG